MLDKFEKLSEEKKNAIIAVCIGEFGRNGYDMASTNSIVKAAGISKGILFHYFESKKGLYLYIMDCCIDFYINFFEKNLGNDSTDFFDRILEWTELKLDFFSKDPLTYQFLTNAFIDAPIDLREETEVKYQRFLEANNSLILRNIDLSKFKAEVDRAKAIELIFMTFNGLVDKYSEIYKFRQDRGEGIREEVFNELKEYIKIMKTAFYH